MATGDKALDSKSLAAWTDAELEAELSRRRTKRSASKLAAEGAPAPPAGGRIARALDAMEKEREIAQAYANLELPKGAPLEEVEKKYKLLAAKYAPEKHGGDAARVELARQLGERLKGSYERLVAHLQARA